MTAIDPETRLRGLIMAIIAHSETEGDGDTWNTVTVYSTHIKSQLATEDIYVEVQQYEKDAHDLTALEWAVNASVIEISQGSDGGTFNIATEADKAIATFTRMFTGGWLRWRPAVKPFTGWRT